MSKVLSRKYDSVIRHYHNRNKAAGPRELADMISEWEALDTTDDTLIRQCKRWLWEHSDGSAAPRVKTGNKLVVGDLHAPFVLDGYLEFCVGLYKKYQCDSVIFIGDVLDAHAWSTHLPDVDGMSVGHELDAAVAQLQPWYQAFPVADMVMGNHDQRIANKAKLAGMSKKFLKDFSEIIKAPTGWNITKEVIFDDVLYVHGTGVEAIKRAKEARMSVVQGDKHTLAYAQWSVSQKDKLFGLQVGCGINHKAYSMAYAENHAKKPVISAGLVLENGKLPLVELMPL